MITIILPYYSQPEMLKEQMGVWEAYSELVRRELRLIVVDDGSPIPARGVPPDVALYRIVEDIPWNRGGARNLGTLVADGPWLLHMDLDHVLTPTQAERLIASPLPLSWTHWFRFRRERYGAADETRMKDALPREAQSGEIKPHIDSFLCNRKLYWAVGGYDEDYSGCLGGGSPFLRAMEMEGTCEVSPVRLLVYTRHVCSDASVRSLSRDTTEYSRRRREKELTRNTTPRNPLRFTWTRIQ